MVFSTGHLGVSQGSSGSKYKCPKRQEVEPASSGLESCTSPLPPYSISQSSHMIPQVQWEGAATSPREGCQNVVAVFHLPSVLFSLNLAFVLCFASVYFSLPQHLVKMGRSRSRSCVLAIQWCGEEGRSQRGSGTMGVGIGKEVTKRT